MVDVFGALDARLLFRLRPVVVVEGVVEEAGCDWDCWWERMF